MTIVGKVISQRRLNEVSIKFETCPRVRTYRALKSYQEKNALKGFEKENMI